MLNTFNLYQNLAKHNDFGELCEKLLSDPYVFRRTKNPHINSITFINKFGSNQYSSFREEFCTIVNDDGRHVMAIANMAFGQVS